MTAPKKVAISGLVAGFIVCTLSLAYMPSKHHPTRLAILGFGIGLLSLGYFNSEIAIARQILIDKAKDEEEKRQKLISEATEPVIIQETVEKVKVASDYRSKLHELDAGAGFAAAARQNHPGWVADQLKNQQKLEEKPEQEAIEPAKETLAIEGEIDKTEKIDEFEEFTEESLAAYIENAKKQLQKLIDEHEGGWIAQLMKKPLLIYGDMGSFKSYFAAFLALCRYYLRGHRIVSIADPHFHQNKNKCWKLLVELGVPGFGANYNYEAIGNQLNAMYDRFAVRTEESEPITSIWDELTNYGLEEGSKEPASKLSRKIVSDPRKSNESPINIAHNDTNAAWGGGTGFRESLEGNVIKIKLRSTSEQTPVFSGTVSGIKNAQGEFLDTQEITIKADWIRPEWVYNLFNPKLKKKAKPAEEIAVEPQTEVTTVQQSDSQSDILQMLKENYNNQINWNYLLAESTPEILELLGQLQDTGKSPEVSEVSSTDTDRADERLPEALPAAGDTESQAKEIIAKCFPKQSEKQLFGKVEAYFQKTKTVSRIIREGLKCSKGRGCNRSYTDVGIPLFTYLVRKYGSPEMLTVLTNFLSSTKKS